MPDPLPTHHLGRIHQHRGSIPLLSQNQVYQHHYFTENTLPHVRHSYVFYLLKRGRRYKGGNHPKLQRTAFKSIQIFKFRVKLNDNLKLYVEFYLLKSILQKFNSYFNLYFQRRYLVQMKNTFNYCSFIASKKGFILLFMKYGCLTTEG